MKQEGSKEIDWKTIVSLVIISSIGIFLTFYILQAKDFEDFDCVRYGLEPQFWRGQGIAEPWDSAPNGWYHVQAGWESQNGKVQFPACPSCGSQLHGFWETTVYLPDNFDGDVRLSNNVIVEKG